MHLVLAMYMYFPLLPLVRSTCGYGYRIVFNAQFINNCALSPYALIQFIPNVNKCQLFPGSNEVHVSASTFEDHRPEQADFAVVYNSPSIGAGPDVALF